MKIIKNERKGNTVSLEVQSEYEEFKKAQETTIAEAVKRVRLPGFRPGKAPKAMVEKSLDPEAIKDQASQELISNLYPQIIKEADLHPVDYPKVNIKTLSEGQPVEFTLEVVVYPEVKLGKYKGLKAEKKSAKVTEEEINKALGDMQNRMATPKDVTNRPAEEKDIVDVELETQIDGQPFSFWPKKLASYPIGSSYISKELDHELAGMSLNESKEFKLTMPADHKSQAIAGKEISFKVKMNKITARELSPLDDAFATKVSSFGSLAELKAELQKNMRESKKADSEADLKNKLLEELTKASEVEVPEVMIKQETEVMIDELKTSLGRSGLTMELYLKSINKTEADLYSELRPAAQGRMKGKLALTALSEKENLLPGEAEIEAELKDLEEIKNNLRPGVKEYIIDYLSRRKALDFIVSEAKISTKED